MKILEKITNHKYYRHSKNFSKFTLIGIIWTLIYIFLMWLTVDIMDIPTLIASTTIVAVLFVGKFYAYVFIGLIHHKFIKFATTNIIFSISNIVLVWLFIDILKISTVMSSAIVVYGLFITRFIIFNKIGLIKIQ